MKAIAPNENGYYAVEEKRSSEASIPVVVAHVSAWRVAPKAGISKRSKPVTAFATLCYRDRLMFNGNYVLACKAENTWVIEGKTYPGNYTPVVIADARHFKIVRKAGVKPLKPVSKTGVPIPHPSHRMTKWRTEIRCPCNTSRFYGVRNCTKCRYEQMTHPAGQFSDCQLVAKCGGRENAKDC